MQVTADNLRPGPAMESSSCNNDNIPFFDDADYEINDHYKHPEEAVDTPKTVFVEVLVVVDKYLVEKIGKMYVKGRYNPTHTMDRSNSELIEETKLYVRKFMSAVDIKFQGQFSNPRIKISICSIVADPEWDLPFGHKNRDSSWSKEDEDTLDLWDTRTNMYKFFETVLDYALLKEWTVYQNKKGNKFSPCSYDVILALSGREKILDLHTSRGQTASGKFGLSGLYGACSPHQHSTMVVHDLGTFNGVKTAVHHFGHELGAFHDGESGTPSSSCCRGDGYIMSDAIFTDLNVKNVFKNLNHASSWSSCSKLAINKFVSKAECLFNQPQHEHYPLFSWHELSENIDGMMFSYNQCPGNPYIGQGIHCTDHNPCQFLQCQRKDKCVVEERTYAMEGTYCTDDMKKRCYKGECYEGKDFAVTR